MMTFVLCTGQNVVVCMPWLAVLLFFSFCFSSRLSLHGPLAIFTVQLINVATGEKEAVEREIAVTKKQSEALIDNLKALLEMTDMEITELKKEAYEFRRDIVVGAENFRTGKTMAEKMLKYMEDKLRQKDSAAKKLKLKNSTLKSQIQKVEQQLRQKEEMGDVLHYIDFHQLQIENTQYNQKIEERNQELLKLKMTTGNTVQKLNLQKMRLNDLLSRSTTLQSEIEARKSQREGAQKDTDRVTKQIKRAKRIQRKFYDGAKDNPKMPKTLDYVRQKAEAFELQKAIQSWERKVQIAKLEHKTCMQRAAAASRREQEAQREALAKRQRRHQLFPRSNALSR